MPLSSWLSSAIQSRTQTRRRAPRTPTPRFRPQLEALERRDVPSTVTVTNNLDSGAGSLRAVIAAANSGDTVNFATSLNGQTITLTSGPLNIARSLTIQRPGASQLTISGDHLAGVFEADATATVVLSGLTISNGAASLGSGILNYAVLTVSACTITGNTGATSGGGIFNDGTLTVNACTVNANSALYGGGIYNIGALTVSGTTIDANSAAEDGAGIYNGAGGNLTVSQSTFYHNTATVDGGGIYMIGGTATLTGCSFTDNLVLSPGPNAGFGGGVYVSGRSTLTLTGCTLSQNAVKYRGGGIYINSGATVTLDSATVADTINNTDGTGANGRTANIDGTYILQSS